MSIKHGTRFQRGTTLIELIVFIVVVSVGLAGVLTVFNVVVKSSADPLVTKQATAVADAMMEEVLLKDFANPTGGWSGGATLANRPNFDDVGDYNGYSSVGVFSLSDLVMPVLTGYNVGVTVVEPAAAIGGVAVSDIRQITVTVAHGAETYTLTGYRFNYD